MPKIAGVQYATEAEVADLDAVVEGLMDRLIGHFSQTLPPTSATLSAAANATQRILDVAVSRMVALEPEKGLASHALNVASVGAFHSGQVLAVLSPLVRLSMADAAHDQLAAGMARPRGCDCAKCRGERGQRQ